MEFEYILYIKLNPNLSAYLAVELDRQFRDEPTQIRVTMGKEPRHFMAMFGGKMLVYEGGTGRSTVQYGVHNW